jgi:hypothetical protein
LLKTSRDAHKERRQVPENVLASVRRPKLALTFDRAILTV